MLKTGKAALASPLDRGEGETTQDDLLTLRPGRVRVRTLVAMRWLAVFGQSLTLIFVTRILHFAVPALCWGLVTALVLVNLAVTAATNRQRLAGDLEAFLHIAFDLVQLSAMVYLTGGQLNAFSILMLAPIALASVTLPLRYVMMLSLVGIVSTILVAVWALPLPSAMAQPFDPPVLNRVAAVIARAMTITFVSAYGYLAAREARRMELALNVTGAVLAREQRLSALGALAAAAAHELGTPLATIQVIAREMRREAKTADAKEDADLLLSQAERCREILRRLTETPDAGDAVFERLSLLQLVQEAIKPHEKDPKTKSRKVQVEAVVTGAPDSPAPDIWRRPEILHAMTTIIDNAVDFARAEVLVTARFDAQTVTVEVADDGPGFSSEVLDKLGEPYVTTRPAAGKGHSNYVGMGLGFFIAKTLLERTGATVTFYNGRSGGAVVAARWPRGSIEASAPDLGATLINSAA